jgi:hypothetical protein
MEMFKHRSINPSLPNDKDAMNKELGSVLVSRNYKIGRAKLSARIAGGSGPSLTPEEQHAVDRERELQESLKASEPKRPNRDFQGIPTSAGGKLGRSQYITQDIREIAASRDRFSILQALDEIRLGRSTWSPAWGDVRDPMHVPVREGFRLLVDTLDDLDKK